jgi:hypothetical protein
MEMCNLIGEIRGKMMEIKKLLRSFENGNEDFETIRNVMR